MNTTRRQFLGLSVTAAGAFALRPFFTVAEDVAPKGKPAVFLLASDTHYLGEKDRPGELDEISRETNSRLLEWLNKLPGSELPAEAGGGKVGEVQGVIHGGDCIDTGDRVGATAEAMQKVELDAFVAGWGLDGGDGKLKWPVREVWGNHDSPHGKGIFIERYAARNRARKGLAKVSENGLHYSWDWAGVHFVNLGIVVGQAQGDGRPRSYAPLGSLDFLIADLAENVRDSGRPVVLTHHVDVARYCVAPKTEGVRLEWDHADVAAYHAALANYRIAAILYGHTHGRRVFPWDGAPPKPAKPGEPLAKGIPVFNCDNSAHFKSETQALMYFEVYENMVVAREFATADGWLTAAWTPEVWKLPFA